MGGEWGIKRAETAPKGGSFHTDDTVRAFTPSMSHRRVVLVVQCIKLGERRPQSFQPRFTPQVMLPDAHDVVAIGTELTALAVVAASVLISCMDRE